jgi:FkbM family methyltransferase
MQNNFKERHLKFESLVGIIQGLSRLIFSFRYFVKNFGLNKSIKIFRILLISFFSNKEFEYSAELNLKIRCKSSDISNIIQHYGYGELTNVIPKNTKIYVDLGAYSGISISAVHLRFPDVRSIGVEPLSSNFEYLAYNTKSYKNNINYKFLVGDKNEISLIAVKDRDFWSAQIVTTSGELQIEEVEMITFDKLLEISKLETIDVLKIDIEGSEYALFENSFNLIFDPCKIVIIEMHEPVAQKKDLIDRILGAGYIRIEDSCEFLVCTVNR